MEKVKFFVNIFQMFLILPNLIFRISYEIKDFRFTISLLLFNINLGQMIGHYKIHQRYLMFNKLKTLRKITFRD